jgi:hypothetical protein
MDVDRIVTKGTPSTQKRKPSGTLAPSILIGAAVALVLAVGLLVALLSTQRGSEPPLQPTTQPVVAIQPTAPPTSVPPTATPSDAAIAPYIARIRAHEDNGDWKKAASEAENSLVLPDLSDSNRKILTGYAVSDGLKALYTEPFKPLDTTGQQEMVDRYLVLKQRAHDAGVPIDTPLQVATTTFTSSQFHLARVALEQAFKDGSFKPETNKDATKLYVSTLYGLGEWYTKAEKDSPLYKEGLGWLVASYRIQEKYHLGDGKPEARLSELGFTDKQRWLPAASTPLLN